jgi:hypothetical protein
MALIATRRRGFSTSLSPTAGLIEAEGRTATVSGASSGSSGILFNPGDLGAYASINNLFTEINNNGSTFTLQSTVTRPGGSSKAVRIGYVNEDDGVELYVPNFAATQSLYTRWYMMFSSNWQGCWPVGLKTNRYFTNTTGSVTVGDPPAAGDVYCSTKFVWQRYPPPTDVGNVNDLYVWGLNHACNNMEVPTAYSASTLFGNGLPYLRVDTWYKFELWFVLNSAVNANNGTLQSWVDDRLVFSSTVWPWASTGATNPGGQNRSVTQGLTGWRRMWFGGNISAIQNAAVGTRYRYEDGYYLSTTLDR